MKDEVVALNRWLTNLESEQTMENAVSVAKKAVAQAATGEEKRMADAILHTARYKLADVKRTMSLIAMQTNGKFTIGPPMATEWRTQEEIARDGIIGIYRDGAGVGPVEPPPKNPWACTTVDTIKGVEA